MILQQALIDIAELPFAVACLVARDLERSLPPVSSSSTTTNERSIEFLEAVLSALEHPMKAEDHAMPAKVAVPGISTPIPGWAPILVRHRRAASRGQCILYGMQSRLSLMMHCCLSSLSWRCANGLRSCARSRGGGCFTRTRRSELDGLKRSRSVFGQWSHYRAAQVLYYQITRCAMRIQIIHSHLIRSLLLLQINYVLDELHGYATLRDETYGWQVFSISEVPSVIFSTNSLEQ